MGPIKIPIDADGFTGKLKDLITEKMANKTWSTNTIRAYLNSLLKYTEFLSRSNRRGFINYKNLNVRNLDILEEDIGEWVSSLNRKLSEETKNKAKLDSHNENKVTPDDLNQYLTSKRANLATQMLESPRDVILASMSLKMHNLMRNFILFNLVLCSGQRTGCFINFNLDEFEKAKSQVTAGHHLAYVIDHKTRTRYGAADLVISPAMYGYIKTYIDLIRPGSECQSVFLNWTGSQMDSASVSHALSSELEKTGVDKQ